MDSFPLAPDQGSTLAPRVDALFLALTGTAVFFTVLIFGLIVVFSVRYRRGRRRRGRATPSDNLLLEAAWTLVPLGISLGFFFWGARVYFDMARRPEDALVIHGVGKQWMWKFQHPEGPREINELHVPAGRPVSVTLASEDVIHSFFVPAFRIKQDVVPGRFTSVWFEATRPGTYPLYCAEYCGTNHSRMTGRIVVLPPRDYASWLEGRPGPPPAESGRGLALRLGCFTCHVPGGGERGPDLAGLFGRTVTLADGATATADVGYLRESILAPAAKVTAGYPPIMPTYRGQIGEEDLLRLIAYLRTMGGEREE